MPRPILFLDVSRLVRRYEYFGGPTGLDRVEWRYAHWLLRQDAFSPRAVVRAGEGLAEISDAALRRLLTTLGRRWSSEAPPQFGRNGRSAARWIAWLAAARARRLALLRNARVPDAGGAVNVTLNVGHDGLDEPARFKALPGPLAALFSDLIPLTHPEYDSPRATALHAQRVATLAEHARHVFTISEATRAELLKRVPKARFSTSVAHLGPGLSPPTSAARFERPTFVHLSSIDRRKNLPLLLHLWRDLSAEPDPPALLVIGRRGNDATALEMLDRCEAIRPHVTATGSLGDAAVAERLAGARALLSPSFTEGFGLPLAEARLLGVPAVASDIAAHREIGGGSTRLVSPLDGPGWREAILTLARDDRARDALCAKIIPPASWEDHFAAITETLRDIAARR
jgi:glycosyltransferase involved in cell wall biosynthesis